jgi:hypothetical protein
LVLPACPFFWLFSTTSIQATAMLSATTPKPKMLRENM